MDIRERAQPVKEGVNCPQKQGWRQRAALPNSHRQQIEGRAQLSSSSKESLPPVIHLSNGPEYRVTGTQVCKDSKEGWDVHTVKGLLEVHKEHMV